MSFSSSIASDSRMMDDIQTISFTSKLSTGDVTDSDVPGTIRYEISRREVFASNGYFTGQDVVFEIQVSVLSRTPAEGDLITEADGTNWYIVDVQKTTFDTIWRCVTRKERT